MSTRANTGGEPISHERRKVIHAAGPDSVTLGARLQGAQHFGLTVQNMDRAFEFYTEVLGGIEVMRDGDFHGAPIHNTLLTDQEIIARELKVDPRTIGVPDLKDGAQRLDVRFVQFDNFVIELLQYRGAEQPMGKGDSWAEPRDHMSPAYPRSMHICFYIRDDVNFAKFISDLEAECARRGMAQVKANRVITVETEEQRKAAPMSANVNKITQGKSNGWSLIYCKGPEGEQLEFVQALGPVKETFQQALAQRCQTQSADCPGAGYSRVPDNAFSVVAEIRAKPGKENELRAATLPLIELVRSDPKTIAYFLQEDREANGHFIFYEVFANESDFEAHNAKPYVQAWFAKLPELAEGGVHAMKMKILTPLQAPGDRSHKLS